jgi:hypothetical protein
LDHTRFDDLTRLLASDASRRSIVCGLGAAALGFSLGIATVREVAAGKKNGKRCKKAKDCCSGTCQGKKGKKKCKNTAGARGCTIEDVCGAAIQCPDVPGEASCVVTRVGKPFWTNLGECVACDSDADCAVLAPGAKCVDCPDECGVDQNFRACVGFVE